MRTFLIPTRPNQSLRLVARSPHSDTGSVTGCYLGGLALSAPHIDFALAPTSRELLEAEAERRKKAGTTPCVMANATAVVEVAADVDAQNAVRLARVSAICAARRARWQAQIDAEPSRTCGRHGAPLTLEVSRTADQSEYCGVYTPVFGVCSQCEAETARRRPWKLAGIPERVIDATFCNYETPDTATAEALHKARQYAERAKSNGGFLVALGTPGTGKGHLAVGAAKVLSPNGHSVLFVTHADLMLQLRGTYGDGDTEAFVERLLRASVLILDEVGVGVGGKDEAPLFYQVLAGRHDRRKPTMLTTNETLTDLKTLLGYRIMDRIREDYVLVNLAGTSWRTRHAAV